MNKLVVDITYGFYQARLTENDRQTDRQRTVFFFFWLDKQQSPPVWAVKLPYYICPKFQESTTRSDRVKVVLFLWSFTAHFSACPHGHILSLVFIGYESTSLTKALLM